MRDSLLLAGLYRLRDQRVHWPFIIMLVHREEVHERRYVVNIDHLYEADKFLIPICADKFTSIQIRREPLSYRFKIFPEMPEGSPVSYGGMIINSVDATYEIVIKPYDFHDH